MRSLYLIAFVALALSSCQTSSDVFSGSKFQKRKYCKGWYSEKSSDAAKTETATTASKVVAIQQEIETRNISTASATVEEVVDAPSQVDRVEELQVSSLNLQSTDSRVSTKTVLKVDDDFKTNFAEANAAKKKKKKEKIEPLISWGLSSSSLSTWFWGWSFLLFLNIPILGIIFGALGLAICFAGLSKLKKPKRKKKRNLLRAIVGILFGLLSIIVCLAVLYRKNAIALSLASTQNSVQDIHASLLHQRQVLLPCRL